MLAPLTRRCKHSGYLSAHAQSPGRGIGSDAALCARCNACEGQHACTPVQTAQTRAPTHSSLQERAALVSALPAGRLLTISDCAAPRPLLTVTLCALCCADQQQSVLRQLLPGLTLASGLAVLAALCAVLPPLPGMPPGAPALAFAGFLRLRLPQRGLQCGKPAAEGASGAGGAGPRLPVHRARLASSNQCRDHIRASERAVGGSRLAAEGPAGSGSGPAGSGDSGLLAAVNAPCLTSQILPLSSVW